MSSTIQATRVALLTAVAALVVGGDAVGAVDRETGRVQPSAVAVPPAPPRAGLPGSRRSTTPQFVGRDNRNPLLIETLTAQREVNRHLGRPEPRRSAAAHRGPPRPTLILQDDPDAMLLPKQSHLMAGLIPGARLILYPNASHGSIFQYAETAAHDVLAFLAA